MFSKEQRNGIFLLLLIIIILQCVYFFIDIPSNTIDVDEVKYAKFSKEIDSIRQVQIEANKPKVYPFNPNYIDDFKGANLGMSNEEIDRLLAFRSRGEWINSKEQFQKVTNISDSLLLKIAPLFKFPEWVTNLKKNKKQTTFSNRARTFEQKEDLNIATAKQLQSVYGVGEVLSKRIIKYRDKYSGGFIGNAQLQDVYGITPEVSDRILMMFTVKTPRQVAKVNLNTTTIDELVKVQYIDYEIAHNIIEQRQLREGYKSLDELTKVKDFPVNKIDIIKLYLYLD